jgi:hypothetical protein
LERLSGKYYLKDALEGLVRYQIPFEVLGDKFNQDMVAQEVNNQRSIEDKLQLVALSGFNFKLDVKYENLSINALIDAACIHSLSSEELKKIKENIDERT